MDNNGVERVTTLLDLLSDWYWEQDEEHRFTRIEGAVRLAERLKRVREAALGRRRWEAPGLAPIDGDWEPHRDAVFARLAYRDLLLRSTVKNGETRYLSVTGEPRFDEGGSFVGYRGITRDVTAHVMTEQALRESEGRNRAVVNSLYEGVFVRDRDETIVACNARAERIFGLCAGQILGRKTLRGGIVQAARSG